MADEHRIFIHDASVEYEHRPLGELAVPKICDGRSETILVPPAGTSPQDLWHEMWSFMYALAGGCHHCPRSAVRPLHPLHRSAGAASWR
jgi:hypothetical protein